MRLKTLSLNYSVMIDYAKFVITGINPNELLNNSLLNFFDKIERKTGLLGTYQQAKYKGLLFKIYYGNDANEWYSRITFEGSLHKFWNNGKHNYNDFGIKELLEVLEILKTKFGITPKNCYINQIEIGINLNVDFNVYDFLTCCIMHKTNRLKWHKTNSKGHYLLAEYQRYIFKLYDKATQYKNQKYKIENEILRIEIKYRNMEDLRTKYKIFTFEDLLVFGLENFIPLLIEKWQEVVFYENEIFENTKYKHKYNNVNFWEELKPENFKYHRKEMYKKIKKHGKNTKDYITKAIQEKSIELLQILPKLNINV